MHTTCQAPARVYLHPSAATSIPALRAIQRTTGRVATIHPTEHRIRLLTPAERAALDLEIVQQGGAA